MKLVFDDYYQKYFITDLPIENYQFSGTSDVIVYRLAKTNHDYFCQCLQFVKIDRRNFYVPTWEVIDFLCPNFGEFTNTIREIDRYVPESMVPDSRTITIKEYLDSPRVPQSRIVFKLMENNIIVLDDNVAALLKLAL